MHLFTCFFVTDFLSKYKIKKSIPFFFFTNILFFLVLSCFRHFKISLLFKPHKKPQRVQCVSNPPKWYGKRFCAKKIRVTKIALRLPQCFSPYSIALCGNAGVFLYLLLEDYVEIENTYIVLSYIKNI